MKNIINTLLIFLILCSCNNESKTINEPSIEKEKKEVVKQKSIDRSIEPIKIMEDRSTDIALKENRQALVYKLIHNNHLDSLKKLNLDSFDFSRRFRQNINQIFDNNCLESFCDSNTYKYLTEIELLELNSRFDTATRFIKAIDFKNKQLIKYWLEHSNEDYYKQEVDLDESGEIGYFISPFGKALESNNIELIDLFRKYGVSIEPKDLKYTKGKSIIYILDELIKQGTEIDSLINVSIIDAVYFGNIEKVKIFNKYGAKFNIKSKDQIPLFHYNVISQGWPMSEGFDKRIKITRYMLVNGVDVNAQNAKGQTVAHIILGFYSDDGPGYEVYQKDRINFLKLFVEYGINLNIKDNEGFTFYDMLQKSPHHLVKEYVKNNAL